MGLHVEVFLHLAGRAQELTQVEVAAHTQFNTEFGRDALTHNIRALQFGQYTLLLIVILLQHPKLLRQFQLNLLLRIENLCNLQLLLPVYQQLLSYGLLSSQCLDLENALEEGFFPLSILDVALVEFLFGGGGGAWLAHLVL